MIGVVIVVAVVLIAGSNVYVYATTKKQVNASLEDADCILVLGAGVRNNKPTPMLNDRLEVAIQLYKDGKASKIIMSGDHGQEDYNEVGIMKTLRLKMVFLLPLFLWIMLVFQHMKAYTVPKKFSKLKR